MNILRVTRVIALPRAHGISQGERAEARGPRKVEEVLDSEERYRWVAEHYA